MADAIAERAALADRVPARYRDAWARLCHQKPAGVSEAGWRLALDDGGRFLDAWGSEAAKLGWTVGALFDVANGLIWRLAEGSVVELRAGSARTDGGRMIAR